MRTYGALITFPRGMIREDKRTTTGSINKKREKKRGEERKDRNMRERGAFLLFFPGERVQANNALVDTYIEREEARRADSLLFLKKDIHSNG